MPKTTLIFSSVFTLLYVWLSIGVIRLRRKHKISIGDGGEKQLARAMRAHGNFSEYVPLILALLLVSELNGANSVVVTTVGSLFLAGRILHAYAFLHSKQHFTIRVAGMMLTLLPLVAFSLFNIALYLNLI